MGAAPYGGGCSEFQSTLPVWGAIRAFDGSHRGRAISIHAPRVGSDICSFLTYCVAYRFQSTLPVWGATGYWPKSHLLDKISIHAPRVGSDRHMTRRWLHQMNFNPRSPCGERPASRQKRCGTLYFNPRSPCGERLSAASITGASSSFQSTLPVWGATRADGDLRRRRGISIHAPRVGSDSKIAQFFACNFAQK